jgi:O-acetylhomoserine (thiol)-lyase
VVPVADGGLKWGLDLPAPLLPLAFILRMRTVPLRNLGACISPDNSWMFLQGIETLPLRMEKHCSNALAVAKFLKSHPKVAWVKYPGLEGDKFFELQKTYLKGKGGSMVVFGVKDGVVSATGSNTAVAGVRVRIQTGVHRTHDRHARARVQDAGKRLIESFTVFSHVANVGDAKSLAIHPASTTHSQLNAEAQVKAGIPPEMVRLSVGLEDPADLIADLEAALEVKPARGLNLFGLKLF